MKAEETKENPFLNIAINILLPVLILNKGTPHIGANWALILALCLPLGYGLQDYIRRGHKNYVSLLGLISTASTGALAMMTVTGIWFAVKEASMPLILGLMVLGSAWSKNPAARLMFCNPQVFNMKDIEERLVLFTRQSQFEALLKRTTLWLSVSFFISSIMNFLLAWQIFKDIDPQLAAEQHNEVLNAQIAQMTWMGFAVIALPLMVFSGILIYVFLRRISALTELPINALIKS